MTNLRQDCRQLLETLPLFASLPASTLDALASRLRLVRYPMGQTILIRNRMPDQIIIIAEGRVRLLGYDHRTNRTLQLLEPGALVGWISLIRGIPCETAIASTDLIAFTLAPNDALSLLQRQPGLAPIFSEDCTLIELFDLLGAELARRAYGQADLKQLALQVQPHAQVHYLPPGKTATDRLDPNWLWLVSSGSIRGFPVGSRLDLGQGLLLQVEGFHSARLIGVPLEVLRGVDPIELSSVPVKQIDIDSMAIPMAPDRPPESRGNHAARRYPFVRGHGPLDGALACFHMLSRYFEIPLRRDVIRRVLRRRIEQTGEGNLQLYGAIAELMGLKAQLVTVPAVALGRIETPALIQWQEQLAVVFAVSTTQITLALPEKGIRRFRSEEIPRLWAERGKVLLLQRTAETAQSHFGLSWFLPALQRYWPALLTVLTASFFVQLFGLAHPLIIQVIIDKVLIQNSPDTLNVLGILLIGIAGAEAILGTLRTYVFVDTTNRIDLSLGSQIIDHLLRLPLRYFERRPVGELASRVNELENIRKFLTGTALTVVLDSIFSVIYIGVMFLYSWLLTLVALATVPLFALVTLLASPIIRRQLRAKAECNAQTQSYLVEVVSGIQTVKAQNIELHSRWQWQERYARYVSTGFRSVITGTISGTSSTSLNKLSGLLLLWVGAHLVLAGQLTLGQLIAFRIIAGYVTSPLLRLVQLFQNFQETALSLERLSDILDTTQEAEAAQRQNIPMPEIQGHIRYEQVSFRFASGGPLQLDHITLDIPAGIFVGIVGQSGSGKSTLVKLLARLYQPELGRILVDGYDINKVELYSLRQQIGMVLQDPLLFDGTVQDNIALSHPDVSPEEIVAAARLAVAHDFIMALPQGYMTSVGERGASLSGGQRQRLAIARTILQNPRLLILDEATSALDYSTERQVCQNLTTTFHDKTILLITHRLNTIRSADHILVMDQGRVAEQGTHTELMDLRGRYYALYQQQEAQV